jgi:hypothetical protein
MNDLEETEAVLRKAMDAIGEMDANSDWYGTRVAFAWDALTITEGRDQIIPKEEWTS